MTKALRAASLIGLLFAIAAHPVDREIIRAVTGDGCGQVLYPRGLFWLSTLALLGNVAFLAILLMTFIRGFHGVLGIAVLVVWSGISISFLLMFYGNLGGIYGCDIFTVPSRWAKFIEIGRAVLTVVVFALAAMWEKRQEGRSDP